MPELTVAPAQSDADADAAFELALRVFTGNSRLDDYPRLKTVLWKEDPHFAPENLLLARDIAGRLAGVIRLVPRILYRTDQKLTVAGISSVCVDPDFRGKGYSSSLMEFAVEQSRMRGFDLALLIARRAADHYYTQFGFRGISSYNKVTMMSSDRAVAARPAITLSPARAEHVNLYAQAYLACYRETFGYFERTPQYWDFLLKKIGFLTELRWLTIEVDGAAAGYVIQSDNVVHEIAWTGDLPLQQLADVLSCHSPHPLEPRPLVIEISPQHRLFSAVVDMDVTVAYRECSYGGHMVRILNPRKACDLLEARITQQFGRLGLQRYSVNRDGLTIVRDERGCRADFSQRDFSAPSYAQTCRLLGAHSLSSPPWDIDLPLPFNVSFPDQL